AAAVSDFGFGKIWSRSEEGELNEVKDGKISTRDGHLLAELIPTPKIIGDLRRLFPTALIVGWKFEVDGARDDVLERARLQLRQSSTNACVANGPAYGSGFGLVRADGQVTHFAEKHGLFAALEELMR